MDTAPTIDPATFKTNPCLNFFCPLLTVNFKLYKPFDIERYTFICFSIFSCYYFDIE